MLKEKVENSHFMRFPYFSRRLIFVRHKRLHKRTNKVFPLIVIEWGKIKEALPSKFQIKIFFQENCDIIGNACRMIHKGHWRIFTDTKLANIFIKKFYQFDRTPMRSISNEADPEFARALLFYRWKKLTSMCKLTLS